MKLLDVAEKSADQVVTQCHSSDGPFCTPMDKYYKHSKSLYRAPVLEET